MDRCFAGCLLGPNKEPRRLIWRVVFVHVFAVVQIVARRKYINGNQSMFVMARGAGILMLGPRRLESDW